MEKIDQWIWIFGLFGQKMIHLFYVQFVANHPKIQNYTFVKIRLSLVCMSISFSQIFFLEWFKCKKYPPNTYKKDLYILTPIVVCHYIELDNISKQDFVIFIFYFCWKTCVKFLIYGTDLIGLLISKFACIFE